MLNTHTQAFTHKYTEFRSGRKENHIHSLCEFYELVITASRSKSHNSAHMNY